MTEKLVFIVVLLAGATAQSQLDCDFEANLCQWKQEPTTDNFDWTRQKGTTSSRNTGPTRDHTTGGGFYVYIEATGVQNGYKAQLVSTTMSTTQTQCLQFWYHMYGQHVYDLNVYLKSNNALGKAIWTRRGTQGNRWIQANINLPRKSNFQVIFEGIRGSGYQGDIAIDDIKSFPGNCPSGSTIRPTGTAVPGGTTPAPVLTQCNFESGLCGWTQDTKDNFDWTRQQGATPSGTTGPSTDHTYKTGLGYYIYIETSSPRVVNDTARISTPRFQVKGRQCLEFWYHMYGQHIGTLNVYSKRGNNLGYPIWTKSADQGDAWNIARVTVNARTPFQVVFEAIRGTNYAGDIAIDDFKLSNGACATAGSCDFETDTCTWSNGASDDFDWIRRQGVTPSQGTGPSVDHTKGTAVGYYVFIEASSPRRPGDRAVFSSQSFNSHANARCLRFWFHMLGNHVGTLRVSQSVNGLDSSLWQLSGNQSNSWKQASVPIAPQKSAYKLTIEGIVGQGYQGDIALDDIQISYRTCRLQPGKATPSTATTVTVPTKATPTTPSTGSGTTTPSAATVNCNFDNGFCGWTHSTKDNFDWLRNRGATSSRNTGPTQDHTGNGYYIYIEASGKTQNKTSMIETPQVPASTTGHCLRFWYHMYGDQIGTLNVYMKNRPNLGRPLFTKSGSLGNKWIQANVTLNSRNRAFTVVFEGLIGTGFRGDIALDDVTVSTGNCQSTTPASSRSCDFEDAKICGYTQDKTGDQFDWTRASGATSSGNTGPSNDHTYGTPQGEYMYIEVSAPRKVNDIARLTSPKYKDNQAMCLQFYYHMYGQDIGTLNVYAKVNQALGGAVFSMKGDQGNKWQVGQATIPAAAARRGYQLVFEGIRGSNYRGDIAIDDISMTKGACTNPGACDFETGLCTWTNVQAGDQFDWTQGNGGTSSSGTGPTIDHTLGTAAGGI
ncbi:MAM and LDL-receptor class A domain-containing protein 1-like [Lingula anatina]|uniref:MAM and LDL-receptor class A domain-containing protein 1-like n=1 Tax=Lingula anatina TaxID=7574 RepID=A0A1S3II16_LINAN|nr:MAM and LDL-receptor class A domain-containing protein 1-like [Lingula anatina]|eukprot:XP_013397768.1 MAM and LDL-receptor class A domain-containing protein 1-like [Lingula anatina]